MAEKNLPVPYKSQWDSDAGKTPNDCGPASVAMILNYYGGAYTTDEIFEKTGAGQGLISFTQMKKAIEACGYQYIRRDNQSPEDIRQYIDQHIPVIALVKYGSLGPTVQDKNFKGGHFFAVVGYRDDGYFVNDPNFRDSLRSHGDHHFYPKADFERAWADAAKDGNPANSLIIIPRKTGGTGGGMSETIQVEKATFEQLVTKSTAFDELSKVGMKTPSDVDVLKRAVTDAQNDRRTAQDEAKTARDELARFQQAVAERLQSPQDLARILSAIDELIKTAETAQSHSDHDSSENEKYEKQIIDLKAEVNRLNLMLSSANPLSSATLAELLGEVLRRLTDILGRK